MNIKSVQLPGLTVYYKFTPRPITPKVYKPADERTKVEYERLLQVIASTCKLNEKGWVEEPTLEGIRHPSLPVEWLAALHILATKFATQAEVSRLLQVSSSLVHQRAAKRRRHLRGRVVRGEITLDQIVG